MHFFQELNAHKVLILGVLFGISEALAQIPQVESNSIFQLISSAIKKLNALVAPAQPPQA